MKRSFDFVIKEDDGVSKIVLRFYPKKSRVYTFVDEPPKSWDEVYKTYMTYSVLCYSTYKTKNIIPSTTPDVLFSSSIDEGEGLLDVRQTISNILNGDLKKEYLIYPLSFGVDWEIREMPKNKDTYIFTMIKNITGEAFRFELPKEKLNEFYTVLNEYLEYILKYRMGS